MLPAMCPTKCLVSSVSGTGKETPLLWFVQKIITLLILMVAQVNFNGPFVAADGEADIEAVADHVEHIAKVAGVKQ